MLPGHQVIDIPPGRGRIGALVAGRAGDNPEFRGQTLVAMNLAPPDGGPGRAGAVLLPRHQVFLPGHAAGNVVLGLVERTAANLIGSTIQCTIALDEPGVEIVNAQLERLPAHQVLVGRVAGGHSRPFLVVGPASDCEFSPAQFMPIAGQAQCIDVLKGSAIIHIPDHQILVSRQVVGQVGIVAVLRSSRDGKAAAREGPIHGGDPARADIGRHGGRRVHPDHQELFLSSAIGDPGLPLAAGPVADSDLGRGGVIAVPGDHTPADVPIAAVAIDVIDPHHQVLVVDRIIGHVRLHPVVGARGDRDVEPAQQLALIRDPLGIDVVTTAAPFILPHNQVFSVLPVVGYGRAVLYIVKGGDCDLVAEIRGGRCGGGREPTRPGHGGAGGYCQQHCAGDQD